MAAVAFDTLKCARRLKDVGYTDQQAEVQAEIMAEAFVFNIDALVTKDYLDARLDARFAEQNAHIEVQFAEIKGQHRHSPGECLTLELTVILVGYLYNRKASPRRLFALLASGG